MVLPTRDSRPPSPSVMLGGVAASASPSRTMSSGSAPTCLSSKGLLPPPNHLDGLHVCKAASVVIYLNIWRVWPADLAFSLVTALAHVQTKRMYLLTGLMHILWKEGKMNAIGSTEHQHCLFQTSMNEGCLLDRSCL